MFKTEDQQKHKDQLVADQLPSIYVVDGDRISRDLVAMLANQFSAECKAFETAEQYLQEATISRPACLVLELRLSGRSGMELQQLVNKMPLPLPVIIHTANAEVSSAVGTLENGAVSFIEKPCDSKRLEKAIKEAIAFDREQIMYYERLKDLAQVEQELVDRERKVIQGMIIGRLNKSIARDLDVSVRTIENVRSGLLQKFKANNSAELVSKYTELLILSDLASRLKPAKQSVPKPHYLRRIAEAKT